VAGPDIVFSLRGGQVWVSWGIAPVIRLGPAAEVSAMMREFLAHTELADRLRDRSGSSVPSQDM
jgi:hypothetical protein